MGEIFMEKIFYTIKATYRIFNRFLNELVISSGGAVWMSIFFVNMFSAANKETIIQFNLTYDNYYRYSVQENFIMFFIGFLIFSLLIKILYRLTIFLFVNNNIKNT